jgi:hypothetical protein
MALAWLRAVQLYTDIWLLLTVQRHANSHISGAFAGISTSFGKNSGDWKDHAGALRGDKEYLGGSGA